MSTLSVREFWQRIDALNLRKDMTLKEMARLAGINYDSLRNKRSGRAQKYPSLIESYYLAITLGTSLEYLLTGKDESSRYPARVMTIADRCIKAEDEDLMLIERVLGISRGCADNSPACGQIG